MLVNKKSAITSTNGHWRRVCPTKIQRLSLVCVCVAIQIYGNRLRLQNHLNCKRTCINEEKKRTFPKLQYFLVIFYKSRKGSKTNSASSTIGCDFQFECLCECECVWHLWLDLPSMMSARSIKSSAQSVQFRQCPGCGHTRLSPVIY